MAGDESLFRKAALDRLASPERLDERLQLPSIPGLLLVALVVLLTGVTLFALWLQSAL
jgi:hypothetical protein